MTAHTTMDQQFLDKLTAIIDANLQKEDFGVSELANELGMSRVTLHRKVKAVIKKSVSEFIRETRLERAYNLLREKTGTVSEIAYSVGFSSPNYFTKCFHDFYGITPGDVLKGITVVRDEKPEKKWPITKKQVQFFLVVVLLALAVFAIYFFMPPHLLRNSDKNKLVTLVIPPFIDEYPESGNDKAKLIRLELHWRRQSN